LAEELWSWALLAHAVLGLALAAGAAWLALRLARAAQRFALLGAALAAPAAGIASALFEQPLGASLAHAAAAALLVAAAAYAHARLA
jgi:heme A synthase